MNVKVNGRKIQRIFRQLAGFWWLSSVFSWANVLASSDPIHWNPITIQFCSQVSVTTLQGWKANTSVLRAKGYQSGPLIDGILFEWHAPLKRRVWMKDTPVALDLWHLSDQGQITEHIALTPYSEMIVESREVGRYSIETPQHLNLSMRYSVGDFVSWESTPACPRLVNRYPGLSMTARCTCLDLRMEHDCHKCDQTESPKD